MYKVTARMRALVFVSLALAAVAACAGNAPPASSNARPVEPMVGATSAAAAVSVPPDGASAASGAGGDAALQETVERVVIGDASDGAGDAAPPSSASSCNEQPPQDFLVRGQFLKTPDGNQRAIQYRTDRYGYFKGFGRPGPDAQPPSAFAVSTTFMGLPVRMHRKVVPALSCVEQEIVRSCADHPYTAHALAGIRFRNTYRGGEVTNHAYGIAIDVDPSINTCCGCVPPWNDAPACKKHAKSEYDRMAMPECWVHAFERYGFYWLGHDVLRDTMHFEFLGDPDRILKK
jgi:hypothetical protein